ncbi:MAG: hypothetical protein WCS70_06165 [Verrucomicrobiota bacterium]
MAGIFAAFTSFSVFVVVHWAILHWLRWRPLSRVLNGLWLANLGLYAWLFWWWANDTGIVNLLNGLLLQVFLLIGYTAFFFLVERGLSLRVLIEISRTPDGRMTLEEIKHAYPYDYILEKRIGQMVRMGYWVEQDGYFRSTEKGRRFTALHRQVWKILRIGKD